MPGFLGGNKAAAGGVPPGVNLKNALIQAAPLFASMAAGYSSGRGPYAYMDQGIASIQANQKAKRDEEAAAAAAAAVAGLRPGGMGAAGGGGLPIATAPRNPNDPTSISGDTMAALGKDSGTAGYRASLIGTESGGNWKAQNSEIGAGGKAGHFGRVQFGQARLQEAMNAGAIPQGTTPEQFMNSPALQIAAENWHFADLESQLGDLVGREVNGKVMDLPALVAMGHLGGAGGARKYVESGGAYNPSDSFGTSLADYATTHGGSGGAAPAGPVDPMADPYVQQLMTVMAMDGITPEQQAVIQMQLESRIGMLTAPQPGAEEEAARAMRARDADLLGYTRGSPEWNQYVVTGEIPAAADPMDALNLEKAQLEIDALKNPMPGAEEEAARAMRARDADLLGYTRGSPEWNQYVVTGEMPKSASPLEVGGVLLDPTGQNVLFDSRVPPAPEAPTTKTVKLADGSDVMVQWNPETQVWDAAPIPEGGTTGAGKKMTETQSKLTLFQTLQTETAPVLNELEKQFDPSNLGDPSLAKIPIAGNYFTSTEYQMYTTAASAWAEGALRISTGAAATQPEIERTIKTYFAQPGDTPETVAFKASMRAMYDRAVNNALGQDNGGGKLMLPSEFSAAVAGQGAPDATGNSTSTGIPTFNPATGEWE